VQSHTTVSGLQIEACAYLDTVRECMGREKPGMVVLAHVVAVAPLLYGESIWNSNHELVASPDHGVFIGIVIMFSSGTLSLKTDLLSRLTFCIFAHSFSVLFSRKKVA
jgi:hypothetical protein